MSRKTKLVVLLTILVAAFAIYATTASTEKCEAKKACCHFVDADGDGKCDNEGSKMKCKFVDENNDGKCDKCGVDKKEAKKECPAVGETKKGCCKSKK